LFYYRAPGYGDVSPNNCWLANTVITIQSVYALLLNAVVLGIVFARISRPGQRVSALIHTPSLGFSCC
jgi:Inward rectifier potassium channel transmembrane domain